MRMNQTIGIGSMSSALMLAAVIALLVSSGAVVAQQAELTPVEAADPQIPGSPVPVSSNFKSPKELEALGAGPTFIHIAGSTFTPLYGDTNPQYVFAGCTYADSASTAHAIYNFPLTLPNGSTITSLRFYYNDTSASDGTLRLREMDDGNNFNEIAVVSSTGSSGLGYNTVTGLTHVVDYVNYSYVLQYYANVIGSTMQLCGVRIGYIPPGIFGVALPIVQKNQ
jgi:hypothetical protein